MANIKYFRLGATNPVTNASYNEYKVNDGRIVFARVAEPGTWDSTTLTYANPLLYIWANGMEYKIADKNALDYALNQIAILNGLDTSEGSVAYQIKQALDEYELPAEKFVKLVDSSNSNVLVSVSDSSLILHVDARKATITVSSSLPETAEHGDFCVVETDLYDSSIPMRTAYIWDETKGVNGQWVALDGNVSAENVYFPEGVQRTEAWGVTSAQTAIATECEGLNLKELLEYYLVKEKFETGVAKNATFTAPTLTLNPDTDTKPNSLYTYVSVNGATMTSTKATVAVNSSISFNGITLTETYTYASPASQIGTAPTITYATNNKYSIDGTNIIDGTTYTGITPTQAYSYTDTLDDATARLELTNSIGCTGIDSSIDTVTDLNSDNELKLNADTDGIIIEGENSLTLKYTVTGATVTRKADSTTLALNITAYGISNKNNVSTGSTTANGTTISTTDVIANANGTTGNTSITVTGVYVLYTDGSKVSTSASSTIDDGTTDPSNITSFGVINYFSTATITRYIKFAGVELANPVALEIYLPANSSKTFTITSALAYDPTSKSYADDHMKDGVSTDWHKTSELKTINGVVYDIWRYTTVCGANETEFVIAVS